MAHATVDTVSSASGRRVPPGPTPQFLLGNARELRRQGGHAFILDTMQRYGDIACYHVLRWPTYLLSHPDYVKHVLQDNHRNYGKDTFAYRALRLILGNGLLTSEGDFWLRQRRLAQPAFHRQRLEGFGKTMTNATLDMLKRWETYAAQAQAFDVAREMTRLTLHITGETLFNIDLTDEADEVGPALTAGLEQVTSRIMRPFALPLWVPTRRNRQFHKALRTLDNMVYDIIVERRRAPEDRGDLLSMFMLAEDEDTGERMNDTQLRDEVMTIVLAGHETTANALTWTWYLLTQHPDVEAKLAQELAEVLGGRVPTMGDLPQLPYTHMVIQESLRLYPPAYVFHRSAIAEDTIGGYPIPPGQVVSISPYVVHRHPGFWEHPETFDPERFTPERVAGRHRFASIPFAAGPRQCIGATFAMTEAQLVLATVAQRYRVRLVPDATVKPYTAITLRPLHGIQVTLQPLA
ncbi:MAG: cytochrome P450 [Candidatus Tectomicrobia bacterium]